ncbi:MAG: long-chain fatty acid--CoA ligase [Nitrospirae bacterium GWC2_57_9]|nr:MAG: long-chain fatty acid--CoA ligase [Nitrospirae bacterium GWC2_57_9]
MKERDTSRPWIRFYEPSVPPNLSYPDIPLGTVLSETAAKFPDHTALHFYGRKITYSELDRLANRFGHALTELGVIKGDRVALMLPNIPQMVIAYYGTVRTGAIAVPTNPLYHEHELEVQLKDSGAETLVAVDLFYPVIAPVLPRTGVKHLILCGIRDFLPFPKNLLYPIKARLEHQWVTVKRVPPVHDFLGLVRKAPEGPVSAPVLPDDIALLQYTGGTTGVPKGAILTHRNLVVNAAQSRAWLTLRTEGAEKILSVIPFFHVYGMTTAMNLGILIGAELILLPKFHTKDVLQTIQQYRPGIFPGIQAMYLAIGNHPDIGKYDLSSLKVAISGAGPLMREVQDRFEQVTKARIVEGYGLSEASPVTHANPIFGRRKIGSIGLPWPDLDARIMDIADPDRALPPGEVGELVVKGPQVMKGYWNKPGETAQTLRGGWLHTGDIARMDDEGYFYIVDRIKDMIKTVGENVYPREVEEVLYAHPKVKEAVVVGIPQDFLGEEIKAYIVLKEGMIATAEEIMAFCRVQLSKFKVPKQVEFRKELPKTLVGKVLRRVLKAEELKKLEKA